jgi:hypothetical protein
MTQDLLHTLQKAESRLCAILDGKMDILPDDHQLLMSLREQINTLKRP